MRKASYSYTEGEQQNSQSPCSAPVYLCCEILAELKNVTGEGKYIFQGQGLGSNADNDQHIRSDSVSRTIARYRKRHADVKSFNLQDIRRTVKTVLGAQGVDKQSETASKIMHF